MFTHTNTICEKNIFPLDINDILTTNTRFFSLSILNSKVDRHVKNKPYEYVFSFLIPNFFLFLGSQFILASFEILFFLPCVCHRSQLSNKSNFEYSLFRELNFESLPRIREKM